MKILLALLLTTAFLLLLIERTINLRFNNSHVKHVNVYNKKYIEGDENHMSGTLVSGELLFAGTNSHGDPTYMKGKARLYGRLFVLWGYAHGYKKYPTGRFLAALAWKGEEQIYFVAPTSIDELLVVTVDYEEI